MQPNEYYSLIVSSEGGHWNQAEGSTPKGRFHFCSVEPVIGRFSPLNDTVELSLKQFPAIFACETRSDPPTPAYVGRNHKVEHRTDTYYLHFERDYSVDPIPQEKMLAMAEALDIHKPHRGPRVIWTARTVGQTGGPLPCPRSQRFSTAASSTDHSAR
ncbi:hypothetical protein ACFFYR_15890 [Paraburkholderia dipogonis]|uniref:hypothetical protein n=1 Tax=Paraburkholderia dipogonis TaxID=1211383 RepID=UPI0035ECAD2D